MKAFDFYCGAGGLTRGLLDAGIEVVAGFDCDELCRATYEHNNPDVRFVHSDIREIGLQDLTVIGGLRRYADVLFAGCAPCQPFSLQRKGNGPRQDATLLGEFGRVVEAALPGYVLIENVPGIARVRGYSTFRRFIRMLDANGYLYVYGVLDAKHYGVPQNRRRLVLLATRHMRPSLPEPKYGSRLRPFRTVRQAITHFPVIAAGECHPDVPNHVAASITELNLERLRHTPHDGGDRRSWPKRLRLECHKGNYKGHTDVYGRMSWGSPAPALTGRCHSISNGRYGHPEQDRAISLREAAAIQSFPDGYVFFGSKNHIAMQIGNAVPVRLAEHIGKHILDLSGGGHT
jgi:DNA (cytosine-5)-methyltransferase 1